MEQDRSRLDSREVNFPFTACSSSMGRDFILIVTL